MIALIIPRFDRTLMQLARAENDADRRDATGAALRSDRLRMSSLGNGVDQGGIEGRSEQTEMMMANGGHHFASSRICLTASLHPAVDDAQRPSC
ncbi:MAG: hypothetical protein ACOY7P_02530 [Pseudomonadota bacterium]